MNTVWCASIPLTNGFGWFGWFLAVSPEDVVDTLDQFFCVHSLSFFVESITTQHHYRKPLDRQGIPVRHIPRRLRIHARRVPYPRTTPHLHPRHHRLEGMSLPHLLRLRTATDQSVFEESSRELHTHLS